MCVAGIEVLAVSRDRQRNGRHERLGTPHVEQRQCAGRGVALERHHCIAGTASHVDLAAIRGDDDAARASKAVDPAQPLLLCLDEREGAGGTVAGENRHRTVADRRDVDMEAVRTRRHLRGSRQSVDAGLALLLRLDERQRARGRVAAEDRDRLIGVGIRGVEAARHVDVRAVGAHHERVRPAEPIDAAYPVTLHPDERQHPARSVAAERHQRVVEKARRVNVRAVGTDGDGRREGQALDPRHAVPLHLHGHEAVARSRHRRRGNRHRERQADQWKCRYPQSRHRSPHVGRLRMSAALRAGLRTTPDGRGVN